MTTLRRGVLAQRHRVQALPAYALRYSAQRPEGAAVNTGEVVVYSDGKPWRPVVHVKDVARAFLAVLEAPQEDVHNQAFNVGPTT